MTRAEKEETRKLMQDLNCKTEKPLSTADLDVAFDLWWPRLEERVKAIPPSTTPEPPPRSERDMLEEILERMRGFARRFPPARSLSPAGSVLFVDDHVRVTLPPQSQYELELQGTSEQIRQFASILGRRGGNITIQIPGLGEDTTEPSQQSIAIFAAGVDLRPDDVSRAATEAGLILLDMRAR